MITLITDKVNPFEATLRTVSLEDFLPIDPKTIPATAKDSPINGI